MVDKSDAGPKIHILGKSGENGFKEILKRFATHLSDCDGITQIALFFTDRFAPDEYAAYDSLIASYQRKGVVLIFTLFPLNRCGWYAGNVISYPGNTTE